MAAVGENESAGQAPSSVPPAAESAQVTDLLAQFPDADTAAALLVLSRSDGAALSAADLVAGQQALDRLTATLGDTETTASPLIPAPDGEAALGTVEIDSSLSGFDLTEQELEFNRAGKRFRMDAGS